MTDKRETLGDRIIRRANDGYNTRLTTGPKDYPPFALTPWDDRVRWSAYIKKIADEIEAEDAAKPKPITEAEKKAMRTGRRSKR